MVSNKANWVGVLLLCLMFIACEGNRSNNLISSFFSSSSDDDIVYICTGPMSKRYHKTRYCKGLQRCSAEIEEMTVAEAEEYGRTPCGFCY